jgi:hypothetical protein
MRLNLLIVLICLFTLGCLQTGKAPKATSGFETESQIIGYNRRDYRHWVDEDRDCQNTRNEILIATSLVEPVYKTQKRCVVVLGKWYDPYSDQFYYRSKELDLDHLIPLKKAHLLGAYKWSREKKKNFANDPDNLVLVKASLNRQKGAKGPTEWLPPNKSYHCQYLERWNRIKEKYGLNPIRGLASLKDKSCRL